MKQAASSESETAKGTLIMRSDIVPGALFYPYGKTYAQTLGEQD